MSGLITESPDGAAAADNGGAVLAEMAGVLGLTFWETTGKSAPVDGGMCDEAGHLLGVVEVKCSRQLTSAHFERLDGICGNGHQHPGYWINSDKLDNGRQLAHLLGTTYTLVIRCNDGALRYWNVYRGDEQLVPYETAYAHVPTNMRGYETQYRECAYLPVARALKL